jgi:phage replication O-like protein O
MYYRKTTQVPNKLFDIYLKTLSEKELKVLLVVIRQTLGWVDRDGKRKERDWMSQKFLANKTGLSRKSVSQGIDILVTKRLIKATSHSGDKLWYPSERRGKERVYYGISDTLITFSPKPCVKSTQDPVTKGNNTKLTYTKLRKQNPLNFKKTLSRVKQIDKTIQEKESKYENQNPDNVI